MARQNADQGGPRHFLSLTDLTRSDLRSILDLAHAMKKARPEVPKGTMDADAPLRGFVLGMVFEKPSTRTRVSFDMAIRQLGGTSIVMGAADLQLGRGETVGDTAKVLSRYVDLLMLRTDDHAKMLGMAAHADVPVINGLTNLSHPCQIVTDLQTFEEARGPVDGKTLVWIGDGDNMANSWIEAAARLPFKLRIAAPAAYAPSAERLARARADGADIEFVQDALAAVVGADCVMTDTWVSMHHGDRDARMKAFPPFQVNAALLAHAPAGTPVLHCLPAHRGEEITDEVMDGPNSLVWVQAENRLHAQKAILRWCTGR